MFVLLILMELLFKLSFYVINKKNILSLSSLKNMKNEKKSSHLQLQKLMSCSNLTSEIRAKEVKGYLI